MGCGESKNQVAKGNTVVTPSPSKNKNKDVQPILEDPPINVKSPVQKQEGRDPSKANSKVDELVKKSEIVEVFGEKKLKKENVGEFKKESVVEERGKEKLVSQGSPNDHFTSSGKDEETIESIISEGISGKTVYYSPPKESASEEKLKSENAEKKKEAVKESKAGTTPDEAVGVIEGNPMKVIKAADLAEGKPVKEAEVADAPKEIPMKIETKNAANKEEEKTPTANEENVTEIPEKRSETS